MKIEQRPSRRRKLSKKLIVAVVLTVLMGIMQFANDPDQTVTSFIANALTVGVALMLFIYLASIEKQNSSTAKRADVLNLRAPLNRIAGSVGRTAPKIDVLASRLGTLETRPEIRAAQFVGGAHPEMQQLQEPQPQGLPNGESQTKARASYGRAAALQVGRNSPWEEVDSLLGNWKNSQILLVGGARLVKSLSDVGVVKLVAPGRIPATDEIQDSNCLIIDRKSIPVSPWSGLETAAGYSLWTSLAKMIQDAKSHGVPVLVMHGNVAPAYSTQKLIKQADEVFPVRSSPEGSLHARHSAIFNLLQNISVEAARVPSSERL